MRQMEAHSLPISTRWGWIWGHLGGGSLEDLSLIQKDQGCDFSSFPGPKSKPYFLLSLWVWARGFPGQNAPYQ